MTAISFHLIQQGSQVFWFDRRRQPLLRRGCGYADQLIDERLFWRQPTLWCTCLGDGIGQEGAGITKVPFSTLTTWGHALEMQFRKPLQQGSGIPWLGPVVHAHQNTV